MSFDEATSKLGLLLGAHALERLSTSTVMVIGIGGVGSNCVEALARGGIGHLIIVDHDIVEASDINRQAVAFRSTIGRKKVDVMREIIADINPGIEVTTHDRFVREEDVAALIDPYQDRLDFLIDAIDTMSTKLGLAGYAERTGLDLVSSMGAANKLHPEFLEFADLYETRVCPFCHALRKAARRRNIGHLRVLYSPERPLAIPTREGAERSERSNLGTASFMPPIMGMMLAGEVIRALSRVEDDANMS